MWKSDWRQSHSQQLTLSWAQALKDHHTSLSGDLHPSSLPCSCQLGCIRPLFSVPLCAVCVVVSGQLLPIVQCVTQTLASVVGLGPHQTGKWVRFRPVLYLLAGSLFSKTVFPASSFVSGTSVGQTSLLSVASGSAHHSESAQDKEVSIWASECVAKAE